MKHVPEYQFEAEVNLSGIIMLDSGRVRIHGHMTEPPKLYVSECHIPGLACFLLRGRSQPLYFARVGDRHEPIRPNDWKILNEINRKGRIEAGKLGSESAARNVRMWLNQALESLGLAERIVPDGKYLAVQPS